MTGLPFTAVRDAATPHIESLLREWLPNGKRIGREWVVGSIAGESGKSLAINLDTGVGADFALDQKFADIIDVCAAVRHAGNKRAAIKELSSRFGVPFLNGHASNETVHVAPVSNGHDTQPLKQRYVSSIPPTDAPTAPAHKNATPHIYRDANGNIASYVWRIEATENTPKTFRGLSWGSLNGNPPEWHWKHPNPPRMLYGLDRLAARPDAPVIVCEGEKAADAAMEKFPDHVCMTWPGGAGAVSHADWSPLAERDVIVWPDADLPGLKAAIAISKFLPQAVLLSVDDLPPGADAVDIEAPADPAAWLRARLPISQTEPANIESPNDFVETDLVERVTGLGYNRGQYVYYSSGTRQIATFTAPEHTRAHLCSLASTMYWYKNYKHHCNKSGELSWPEVASDLMASCRATGIYNPDRIRGRGVWLDGPRSIVHLGNRLVVDGHDAPLVLPGSPHIYEVGLALLPDFPSLPPPLTPSEAIWLERICQSLRWEKPSAARIFAGWMMLAPICGALNWRPSVWITGASGAGKTWISHHIVRWILGFVSVYVSLSTTEPSLRRLLGPDALPVIWDEGEPDNFLATQRLNAVLGLLRQASAETDAVIARAGSHGGVDTYRIRTMMCFQSVNTPVWSQADVSRIEILPLRNYSLDGDTDFHVLTALVSKHLPPDFGARLFSRAIKLLPVIRKNIVTFTSAIAEMPGQNQRRADQIGTLLAGAFALHSDREITSEEAIKYAAEDGWVTTETPPAEMRDENRLLAHIMANKVRYQHNEYTVSKLLYYIITGNAQEISPASPTEILLDIGIKPMTATEGNNSIRGFAVSNSHPAIRKMLAGTPWASSWGQALLRIPGTRGGHSLPAQRFGPGLVSRAVWIPFSALGTAD